MEQFLDTIYESILDGEIRETPGYVQAALDAGVSPKQILDDGMIEAMSEVGRLFEEGEYFVPEMLISARAMQAGLNVLKPHLVGSDVKPAGTLVIGTVKGDIHDIGKNLVGMMMEGGGFKVVDLGISQSAENFIAAIEEHKPDVVGMSALLTTTMGYMGVVIEALKEKGLRDDVIILVGGAPINDAFAEEIGADAYCRTAGVAVETAKKLMARRTE
jgi:corrinoid protein of di/trimethylamine methyltransferase